MIEPTGLGKCAANYTPLTPVSFLERSARTFPDRLAVVHGAQRYSWSHTYTRCRQLASALLRRGVKPGETVAVMLANTPEMYEAHFGIPMAGAVLNALNTRLDAASVAYMLEHSQARLVITDRAYSETMGKALAITSHHPIVIDVDDALWAGGGEMLGECDYEEFVAAGDGAFRRQPLSGEWEPISINYTSGTTGKPKGIVYHHRGAYLNALDQLLTLGMPAHSVYLWTLPMFHCNGWCFPWAMAANAGTNICLRQVEPETIFRLIKTHRVTHYCAAPIVHTALLNSPPEMLSGIDHEVFAMVAGAAPSAAMIEAMEKRGFNLTPLYELTFEDLPKTATGKIRKDLLRERVKARAGHRQSEST